MQDRKKSSLMVILISASQLIVVLMVVGYIYQYSRGHMMRQEKSQTFDHNQRLLEQCKKNFEKLNVSEVADADYQRAAREKIEELPTLRNSFLLLVENDACELIGENQNAPASQEFFENAQVFTEAKTEFPFSQLASSTDPHFGEITLGEETYLFSGMPLMGGYVLIGEDKKAVDAHIEAVVNPLKKMTFGIFLLVGLAGICFSVLALQRYEVHLKEVQKSLEGKVDQRTRDLLNTQKAVIYGLAKLAESRDNDTGDHLLRIQKYVTVLAKSLRKVHPIIDSNYIRNLGLASSLHDIGKVGVPDAILLKPGRLTPAERGIMELHAVIGGDCLRSIQSKLKGNDFLEMATQIAYSHHERWDGAGYPRGRRETEIPLCARIIAVADVYDALRTKRPYKEPMDHEKSKSIILAGIGTQFDPEVVDAFMENEEEFKRISLECENMTEEEVTPKIKILTEMISGS